MKIHEYQAVKLLTDYGIPNAGGEPATTPEQAARIAAGMPGSCVVKAQIHAGGRGKAGGVKLLAPREVADFAQTLLGSRLVTPQTGPSGKEVRHLLIAPAQAVEREYYLSLLLDTASGRLLFMACAEGGTDIEEVAAHRPGSIKRLSVDPDMGLRGFQVKNLAASLGMSRQEADQLTAICKNMVRMFTELDCTLIEINPLVVTGEGTLLALDAKLTFDDSALFRHKEIAALRDPLEEDPREVEASQYNLNYIQLEGSIGCMVNGAGLAMATMDIIKAFGGTPANFLDVGGGASADKVAGAFRILLSDPNVKGIFVNIFGGIMRCDVLAEGIIEAAKRVSLSVPLVVRLRGTNAAQGAALLKASGLPITPENDLGEAAKRIVQLTGGGTTA